MYKRNLVRQSRCNVRKLGIDETLALSDNLINTFHGLFKVFDITILPCNRLLPVPLIDIQRMKIVKLFVCANRIHIGIKPESRCNVICTQFHPLPLGERVNDLGLSPTHIGNGKRYRPLASIQVVVQPRTGKNEQRSCYPTQVKRLGQSFLKSIFQHFYCHFGSFGQQLQFIFWRNYQ